MLVEGDVDVRKRMRALPSELYAKVFRLRAGGAQPYEIAARLNVPEAEVLKALQFMVERYRDSLEFAGKRYFFVEQAMAIEARMAQLSSLLKEQTRPAVCVRIIRLREKLRKDWLNLLEQAGLVKLETPSAHEHVEPELTDEERRQLIEMALKRLQELDRRKALRENPAAQKDPAQSVPRFQAGIADKERDDGDGTD